MDVTTVADDLVVFHDGARAIRFEGLEPDTEHELAGITVRTLPRPPGELGRGGAAELDGPGRLTAADTPVVPPPLRPYCGSLGGTT